MRKNMIWRNILLLLKNTDITGFIFTEETTLLAFVECKNKPITLKDVCQLLGYSRVAIPKYSFLVAPQGASGSLKSLLLSYNRQDVLQYHFPKGKMPWYMTIARWSQTSQSIDLSSIIGNHF